MAITHTQTVSELTILNNSDNIVSKVALKLVSVDDSDPANLTVESDKSVSCNTSGGTGASGFVVYDSLTQDVILAWTPIQLESNVIQEDHEKWINSVKTPATPTEINKTLPW